MALQIWMPMVSDFNNQGLQNSTITNNSVTLDNNGKLGKCGKFTGSNYISGTINLGDSIEYTLACWVKPPDVSAGNKQIVAIAPNSGWANCRATMFYRQNTAEFIATLSNGTDSLGYTMGMTATPNVWQHIAVTFKNKTMIWYSNGVVQKTLTTTIDPKFSDITAFGIGGASNGAEKFTGYINDVRIYDHALSLKEIEILSRGLVCHYPLNNNGNGQANLLKNSNFTEGSSGSQGYNFSATWAKQTDCMKITSGSASSGLYTANYDNVTTGDMATFSAYVKADASMTIYIGVDGSGIGNCESFTIGTSWQRISISKAKTTNNANLRVYGSGTFYVRHMKYELGSTVTPWCPNSADSIYSSMGYSDTTEYDVSGYGNNMDSHGSITYSSDSPRYSVCPYYQNTDMYLSATSPTSTIRTISFWVKYTSAISSYRVAFGDYKSHLAFGMINSTSVCVTCGGQSKDTFTITAPTANKWYHIVVKRASDSDSADVELYINGIKQTTRGTADNWNHNSDTLMIGRRATGSSVVGYMSDFRAYATPLTEVQIAELYNTAVSVANNGTLMGYELVEV